LSRWEDRISLRIEFYGCDYLPDVLYFTGKAIIRRDLSKHPVTSLRDSLRLRFRTNSENGILVYARGSQGDYLALQLAENRLMLNINLGGRRETSMTLGSLLDDNVFHDVQISRERRDLILSVDRVRIRDRIRGDFTKLNLDRDLYIGGVPHVEKKGLVIYENFTGCIESMYLNHSSVIAGFKHGIAYDDKFYNYEDMGGVTHGCPVDHDSVPVTFKTANSYVRLPG
jgi:contactin associated protein-like 2